MHELQREQNYQLKTNGEWKILNLHRICWENCMDEKDEKDKKECLEGKGRSVSDRGRPGNIRYLFLLLLLLPGKGSNQQILLFLSSPILPTRKILPRKKCLPSNQVMSALIGCLDEAPAFQYEVVRHKRSLQCRGGGRGTRGGRIPREFHPVI